MLSRLTRPVVLVAALTALCVCTITRAQVPAASAPPVAPSVAPAPTAELQVHRVWKFDEALGAVEIDNDFSSARVNACERVGALDYKIVTSPENTPINPSPWYAFRATSEVERTITVRIVVTTSKARPWPYLSADGKTFARVASADYEGGEGAKECVLKLRVGPKPVWVASNHMIGVAEIESWTDATCAKLGVVPHAIGASRGGRAIRAFEFGADDARERIVVIGRQHPPEVSGTVGFMRFVEALAAADDARAKEFRAHYRVLCVPLVNPDGVHEGQWRSTLGAVDANRDWGPFTQQETRVVRDAIVAFAQPRDGDRPDRDHAKLRLLLDFHATAKDIFYIPPPETELDPPHFGERWIAAISARFPDYAVDSSATNNVKEWTFKRWAFETFGAPGITYELGSATPHERIKRIVGGAADEAMRLLLERVEVGAGATPGILPSAHK